MTGIGKYVVIGATVLSLGTGAAVGTAKVIETVVEKIEYNDIHEIVQTDIYKINGEVVTEDEFNEYILNRASGIIDDSVTKEITITADDMDFDGVSRLAQYFDFGYDGNDVMSAKIISDKVVNIKYYYSDIIMSYTDGTTYTGCAAAPYQDVSKTDGLTFTVGPNTGINYDIVKELTAVKGNYLFKFVNNSSYADMKFSDVFSSIVIEVK